MLKLKRNPRPLERGDLRILVLNILQKPMHGYQIMCEFKAHSHGDYKPSTGALYPQLRSLEEEGLIRCDESEGRKNYAVTKAGEEYLKRNGKLVKETMERFSEFWGGNDMGEMVGRMESIARVLMEGSSKALESGSEGDAKRIERSKEVLLKAERELKGIWT
jgi:DNA-binding PadR family transcriptional regulator